jgi:4-alpha-glucanotransferase
MRWVTHNFDYIRLDHFRGFSQFWEIPASEPTAIHGRWVDGPKDDLFVKLREALGGLPFFAEDLGYITPDVHALRERLKIPGMAVLQFGFGDAGAHAHLPHTFTADKVVYTGTHDNDTLLGWWESGATEHERQQVEAYLGRCEDGVNWAMIRAASDSVASLCVVPLAGRAGAGKRCAHECSQPRRKGTGAGVLAPSCCAPSWPPNLPRSPKSPTGFRSRCRRPQVKSGWPESWFHKSPWPPS